MRRVINRDQFTPFGLWINQYLPQRGFSVTNLDYVIEDFKNKRVMLLEEKSNAGVLHPAQCMTFEVLDRVLYHRADQLGYDYWGMFILRFPKGCDMPGPGMTLNGVIVTVEQLHSHLCFLSKVSPPYQFSWRREGLIDA